MEGGEGRLKVEGGERRLKVEGGEDWNTAQADNREKTGELVQEGKKGIPLDPKRRGGGVR